jgi:hypothetical protein
MLLNNDRFYLQRIAHNKLNDNSHTFFSCTRQLFTTFILTYIQTAVALVAAPEYAPGY